MCSSDLGVPEGAVTMLGTDRAEMLGLIQAEGKVDLVIPRGGEELKAYLQQRWRREVPFLHGGTSKSERQAMVDRFQEDPRGPQLFLLSLKAGGVGLNLTRASHVFHIDRWWNPAVENQATDRAYQIGRAHV